MQCGLEGQCSKLRLFTPIILKIETFLFFVGLCYSVFISDFQIYFIIILRYGNILNIEYFVLCLLFNRIYG